MLSKNRIKFIKSLHLKKNRDENKLFIAEGEKIVGEIIEFYPEIIESLYHTKDFDFVSKNEISTEIITENELKQISCLKNPNKAFAICKMWELSKAFDSDFHIALDNIQDPGNMGTIIRLADWFNVKSIICSLNTVDIFNPKVVQASMGSIFRVNFQFTELKTFIKETNLPVFGAFLEGESIYEKKLSPKGILVLGNEGNGISSEVEQLISNKLNIPRFGKAESLNVSVATGILLSEFFRNNS
jgi:RNA methyltransferase, TrmH family